MTTAAIRSSAAELIPVTAVSLEVHDAQARLGRFRESDQPHGDFVAALSRLDGHAAAEALIQRFAIQGGVNGLLPSYALTVLAARRFINLGWLLDGRDFLLGTIRLQIRSAFTHRAPSAATVWLIPSSHAEHTAAHVGALMQIRRGVDARPWLWPGLPDVGSFHFIGGTRPHASGSGMLALPSTASVVCS